MEMFEFKDRPEVEIVRKNCPARCRTTKRCYGPSFYRGKSGYRSNPKCRDAEECLYKMREEGFKFVAGETQKEMMERYKKYMTKC